jgi:hypothetical protein
LEKYQRVIGTNSTVNVNNIGIISSVFIGSDGMWFYNTETGAIEDFQKIYTSGSYAQYEYATYTFAENIFGDGDMYYGYVKPTTLMMDNVCLPPGLYDPRVVSYLHTHPGNPGSLNPSGADKFLAEDQGKPFYVVTAEDYKAYTPQYGGDADKISDNILPKIEADIWYWIKHYLGIK